MAERTCIICRSVSEKQTLLRFVAEGSKLVLDRDNAKPGRGAYIHEQVSCLSRMGQPARWDRALKLEGRTLEPESVLALGRELLEQAQKRQAVSSESGEPPQSFSNRPAGRSNQKPGGKVRL